MSLEGPNQGGGIEKNKEELIARVKKVFADLTDIESSQAIEQMEKGNPEEIIKLLELQIKRTEEDAAALRWSPELPMDGSQWQENYADQLFNLKEAIKTAYSLSDDAHSDFQEELRALPENINEDMLQFIAAEGKLSLELLNMLAEDESTAVRAALPANELVTQDVLKKLARDPEWEVRWAVANSNNAQQEVLESLLNDENPQVSESAREHLEYFKRNGSGSLH